MLTLFPIFIRKDVLSVILLCEKKSVRDINTSLPQCPDQYVVRSLSSSVPVLLFFPSRWWDVDRAFALPSTLSPPPVPVDAGHSQMRLGLRPRPDVVFFSPFVPAVEVQRFMMNCQEERWRIIPVEELCCNNPRADRLRRNCANFHC